MYVCMCVKVDILLPSLSTRYVAGPQALPVKSPTPTPQKPASPCLEQNEGQKVHRQTRGGACIKLACPSIHQHTWACSLTGSDPQGHWKVKSYTTLSFRL